MTTLDGSKRSLNSDILVIADKEEAVAVAGIMGGLDSEVTDITDTILLESANFNQAAIVEAAAIFGSRARPPFALTKGLTVSFLWCR